MKRVSALLVISLCLFGCSKPNYRQRAIEYLKTKVANPSFVDTIKFAKPDSIFTTFYDTPEYISMRRDVNHFNDVDNKKEADEVAAAIIKKAKTLPHKLVGWDVRLVYKSKDKKGAVKTDTCRFIFDATLKVVKGVTGRDIKDVNFVF